MGNIPLESSSSSESDFSDDGEMELSESIKNDFREKVDKSEKSEKAEKTEIESFFNSLLEGIVKNAVESSELRKDESKGKTVTLKPFFTL
jgi:polyribonucleotide nucleotidyltransferase